MKGWSGKWESTNKRGLWREGIVMWQFEALFDHMVMLESLSGARRRVLPSVETVRRTMR